SLAPGSNSAGAGLGRQERLANLDSAFCDRFHGAFEQKRLKRLFALKRLTKPQHCFAELLAGKPRDLRHHLAVELRLDAALARQVVSRLGVRLVKVREVRPEPAQPESAVGGFLEFRQMRVRRAPDKELHVGWALAVSDA